MADQRATDAALSQTDGSSASNGVRGSRHECSASDAGVASGGLRDQVSGRSAATWTPRVESIARSLRVRLGESLDLAAIAAEVEAELSTYANARVTQFIPILVESRVWERLRRRVSA